MSLGRIDEFNPREASSEAYIERLQYYYQANGIEDDVRKKAILMSVCGSETFTILKNLTMPRTTMDLTHAELVTALKKHCEPTPLVIVSRFNFLHVSPNLDTVHFGIHSSPETPCPALPV